MTPTAYLYTQPYRSNVFRQHRDPHLVDEGFVETALYAEVGELHDALSKAAARLAMCSIWIANSFAESAALRAERSMKANHMCQEAAAALAKWDKAA